MATEGVVYAVQQDTATAGESDADELMKAIADERRRRTLRALRDADGAVSLTDLADEIARRERAGERDPSADSERVAVSLYHLHLPKLADAGLVVIAESDERTRVRLTDAPEREEKLSNLLALEES